jgi:hypothetical protein
MVLTAAQCLTHVKHTLGTGPDGSALSPELDGMMVVNQAGEHLVNARPWKYLEGAVANLSLLASQAYISTAEGFPTDFRSPVAMEATDGYSRGFRFTTHEHMLALRSLANKDTQSYYWGVVVNAQSATGGAPEQRIDIYPTPEGAEDGTGNEFRLYYNSTWRHLNTDGDILNIPVWIEALYIQMLRAFARGYEEEDDASLSVRLSEIQRGPIWQAAVDRDLDSQWDMGVLANGGLQTANHDYFWNFSSTGGPA